MSHIQLPKTDCQLCSAKVIIELPPYGPKRDAWEKAWEPPSGWVMTSENHEETRHVCKKCVDRIVKLRMDAGVAE